MTIEGKAWVNASRRTRKNQSGGMHVYINSEILAKSLEYADIPPNSKLKIKRYPAKSKRNNTAKIILEIKLR